MRLSKIPLTIAALSAALTLMLSATGPASGDDSTDPGDPTPADSPPGQSRQHTPTTGQVFPADHEDLEPSLAFHDAVEPIGELIYEHSDVFTGSLLSVDATYLEVFVEQDSLEIAENLLREEGVDPTTYLLTPRENSFDSLEEQIFLARDLLAKGEIAVQAIGADAERDGISLTLPPVVPQDESVAVATSKAMAAAEDALADLDLVGIEIATGNVVNLSSLNDGPAATGGTRLTRSDGAGRCTSAFGIVFSSGQRGQLTAGHCGAGRWHTNFSTPSSPGRLVGSQFTTTYPTNVNRWGDWQVLYGGSSEATRRYIYKDALNSDEVQLISAMQFGAMYPNAELCTYGGMTAQQCRYFVTHANIGYYDEFGWWNYPGVQAERRDTRTGPRVCKSGGAVRGDSGAPVYHFNATGVTGHALVSVAQRCGGTDTIPIFDVYWFAPVRGIKAFDPNASIGGFLR